MEISLGIRAIFGFFFFIGMCTLTLYVFDKTRFFGTHTKLHRMDSDPKLYSPQPAHQRYTNSNPNPIHDINAGT